MTAHDVCVILELCNNAAAIVPIYINHEKSVPLGSKTLACSLKKATQSFWGLYSYRDMTFQQEVTMFSVSCWASLSLFTLTKCTILLRSLMMTFIQYSVADSWSPEFHRIYVQPVIDPMFSRKPGLIKNPPLKWLPAVMSVEGCISDMETGNPVHFCGGRIFNAAWCSCSVER